MLMTSSDVSETKVAALVYLAACLCNQDINLPSSRLSRHYALSASTEDLIVWLELPQADMDECTRWEASADEWFEALRQALYLHIVEALRSEHDADIHSSPIHWRTAQC
jgi:hypothetical protein